ncbi:MAG: hypothetical protein ACK44Z_12020, partial [Pirellulaceae bacterium]
CFDGGQIPPKSKAVPFGLHTRGYDHCFPKWRKAESGLIVRALSATLMIRVDEAPQPQWFPCTTEAIPS